MPNVSITELNKDNWRAVADLDVLPHQKNYVAANIDSIAESQFYPWTRCRVILVDDRIVGFAAFGITPGDQELWLYRFMVAGPEQKSGIGRAALRVLIAEWKLNPECQIVKLSYEPDNEVAERLYVSEGFVPGEIADWGERVAVLDLATI